MTLAGAGPRPEPPRPLLLQQRDPELFAEPLVRAWGLGEVVALAAPGEEPLLAAALSPPQEPGDEGRTPTAPLPAGPGVLVPGGGSSGGRRWCLQPLAHLEASAEATGRWLEGLGLDPAACLHLNPLPFRRCPGVGDSGRRHATAENHPVTGGNLPGEGSVRVQVLC